MKYIKPINEFWGDVLKRDLLGETREEDKFRSKEQLIEYLKSEIEKQGENVVIKNLDVSLIDDLSELFRDIGRQIKTLDLSGWNTSKVTNMNRMFHVCDSLESLDLSGWDTSNVEHMSWMFFYCSSLKSLNLSGWDKFNFRYINDIFYNCPAPYIVFGNTIERRWTRKV